MRKCLMWLAFNKLLCNYIFSTIFWDSNYSDKAVPELALSWLSDKLIYSNLRRCDNFSITNEPPLSPSLVFLKSKWVNFILLFDLVILLANSLAPSRLSLFPLKINLVNRNLNVLIKLHMISILKLLSVKLMISG